MAIGYQLLLKRLQFARKRQPLRIQSSQPPPNPRDFVRNLFSQVLACVSTFFSMSNIVRNRLGLKTRGTPAESETDWATLRIIPLCA